MTTTVLSTPRPHAAAGPADIPLTRLVRVELRKLVDTRAGAWRLVGIGLVTAAGLAFFLFAAESSELTFSRFVDVTVRPQAWLLPVLGIMAVTSKWTHRTGLVTHTVEPRRTRVLTAKFAATGLLGLLAVVLALALAAEANVAGAALLDGNGSWSYGIGWWILLPVAAGLWRLLHREIK